VGLDTRTRVGKSAAVDPSLVQAALLGVVSMVLSVCVHEFAHAYAAFKLDDDTAAREGRLTLNPLVHADPIGTVLLPALAPFLGFGSFGWGRPVPYLPTRLTRKYSMRAGEAIIAFAGPLANLIMGTLTTLGLVVAIRLGEVGDGSPTFALLSRLSSLNFLLFFFNLWPVPPLDGSKIAAWLFGARADRVLDQIQEMGPMFVMLGVVVGGFVMAPLAGVLQAVLFMGFLGLIG
jgi:Zn-dependent protease